jgi:hypothetical protein
MNDIEYPSLVVCYEYLVLFQPCEAIEDPVCCQFHPWHAMIWLTLCP